MRAHYVFIIVIYLYMLNIITILNTTNVLVKMFNNKYSYSGKRFYFAHQNRQSDRTQKLFTFKHVIIKIIQTLTLMVSHSRQCLRCRVVC